MSGISPPSGKHIDSSGRPASTSPHEWKFERRKVKEQQDREASDQTRAGSMHKSEGDTAIPSEHKASLLQGLEEAHTAQRVEDAVSSHAALPKQPVSVPSFSIILPTTRAPEQEERFESVLSQKYEEALKNGAPEAELNLIRSNAKVLLQKAPQEAFGEILKRVFASMNDLAATSRNASQVGNKAANLQRLKDIFQNDRGIQVPVFQDIPHEGVFRFVRAHFQEFDTLWNEFTTRVSLESIETLSSLLKQIQDGVREAFVHAQDFPDESIIKQFADSGKPIMVRSTGKEDSLKVANPGGNESIANVTPTREAIAEAMGKVVASYFSPKSLGQRKAAGDDITQAPFMPVLLQEMVGETRQSGVPVSGVMYTTEPELNTQGVVQISSTFGHAEAVVTGSEPSDTYYVQGEFIHGVVREKSSRKVPTTSGTLEPVDNSPEQKNNSSLTQEQLRRLAEIGHRIEEKYGYPMDVEWSYIPAENRFYVFQARPIPQKMRHEPSYITPEKMKELNNPRQVTVIVAAGGRALELNKENTLFADSALEAEAPYLADSTHPPRAIIIRKHTAANSHEAGFFREREIPLIHVSGEQFDQLRTAMQNETVLLDTQESIAGTLPHEQESSSFITNGLRRHLAPKMESAIQEGPIDFSEFRRTLRDAARQADAKMVLEGLKNTFGRNKLDRLLNAFELASTDQERAFILQAVLNMIARNALPKIPQAQREALLSKIETNAVHVWHAYTTPEVDELSKKFAMNWLRAAILQRPAEGVVNGDTLYVALGEVQERVHGGVSLQEEPFRDIFLRSAKFALTPILKEQWNLFVQNLSIKQMSLLGRFFTLLGPNVVEIWMNSEFPQVWRSPLLPSNPKERSTTCLAKLIVKTLESKFSNALKLSEQAKEVSRQFQEISSDFGDPAKFDANLERLNKGLRQTALDCITRLETATGFEGTVVSHSFLSLVSSYDACIKGLTGSSLYKDNALLKANRLALMLEGYQEVAQRAMSQEMLKEDPALMGQAKVLAPFLLKRFGQVKEEMQQDPARSLAPSPDFSVAAAALGSCHQDPERVSPKSLEDIFTTLHQSLITASLSVERRGGIQLDALPQELQALCKDLGELPLHFEDMDRPRGSLFYAYNPTIQSIEYRYPKIAIRFNCPMQNHSAQFVFEALMNTQGRVESIDFEGNLFLPRGRGYRAEPITFYILNTYYPNCYDEQEFLEFKENWPRDFEMFSNYQAYLDSCNDEEKACMAAPPNAKMKPSPGETVQFHWRLFPHQPGIKSPWLLAQKHLSNIIQFIQISNGTLDIKRTSRPAVIENPWVASYCIRPYVAHDIWSQVDYRTRGAIANTLITEVLAHFTEKKLEVFFQAFPAILKSELKPASIYRQILEGYRQILRRLFSTNMLWSNAALFKESFEFLMYLNPDFYKDNRKIKSLMPSMAEDMDTRKAQERAQKQFLQQLQPFTASMIETIRSAWEANEAQIGEGITKLHWTVRDKEALLVEEFKKLYRPPATTNEKQI